MSTIQIDASRVDISIGSRSISHAKICSCESTRYPYSRVRIYGTIRADNSTTCIGRVSRCGSNRIDIVEEAYTFEPYIAMCWIRIVVGNESTGMVLTTTNNNNNTPLHHPPRMELLRLL